MKTKIDIDAWSKRDHFLLFKNFDEPYHGVCIKIDCTKAYEICKKNRYSFFLYYIHKCTKAINAIEAFHYRIEGNDVYYYDTIHPESTVDRPDGSFGFCHMVYESDFENFQIVARQQIEEVQQSTGLTPGMAVNAIHYSVVPWIDFTSVSHASNFSHNASGCPKITFGKKTLSEGKLTIPVSIHVHHSFIDGRQLGCFINEFQTLMNEDD